MQEAARQEQKRLNRIHRLKANALQDKALFAYTFDRDDGQNPAMKYARRYVEHWPKMKEHGQGLLLWGGVGTGKTFATACIAQAPKDLAHVRIYDRVLERCTPI